MRCHSRFTLHGIAGASKETNTARTGGAAGGPPLCIALYLIGKKRQIGSGTREVPFHHPCTSCSHRIAAAALGSEEKWSQDGEQKGKGQATKTGRKGKSGCAACVCVRAG